MIDTVTTTAEDFAFEEHCSVGEVTFQTAMTFFRRPNPSSFRLDIIHESIPYHIREKVKIQCKLEGLL